MPGCQLPTTASFAAATRASAPGTGHIGIALQALARFVSFAGFALGFGVPFAALLSGGITRRLWRLVSAGIVLMLVAILCKFGGTVLAARVTGIGWRDSAVLGTLLNTRGLTELIVLNLALSFFLSNISLGGHLGGLAAGMLTILALMHFSRGHPAYSRIDAVTVLGLVGIAVGSVLIAYLRVRGYA